MRWTGSTRVGRNWNQRGDECLCFLLSRAGREESESEDLQSHFRLVNRIRVPIQPGDDPLISVPFDLDHNRGPHRVDEILSVTDAKTGPLAGLNVSLTKGSLSEFDNLGWT